MGSLDILYVTSFSGVFVAVASKRRKKLVEVRGGRGLSRTSGQKLSRVRNRCILSGLRDSGRVGRLGLGGGGHFRVLLRLLGTTGAGRPHFFAASHGEKRAAASRESHSLDLASESFVSKSVVNIKIKT